MIRSPLRDDNSEGPSSSERFKNRALELKDQVRSALGGLGCCSSKSALNVIDPMAPRPKYSHLPDPDGVAGRMGGFSQDWPASSSHPGQDSNMSWPHNAPTAAAELQQPTFSDRATASGKKAHRKEAASAAAPSTEGFGLAAPPRGASRRAQLAALGATEVTRFQRGPSAAAAAAAGSCEEDDECAICSESLGAGDTLWRLPCGHSQWHEACIHQWLLRTGTCPMCRIEVKIPRGNQPPPKEEEEDLKGKKGKTDEKAPSKDLPAKPAPKQ
mmetsp:Transcript_8606/g.19180  ORF Transcript_8606/g.19180 Transcript_8606/m.19180 type:complete len:271 (-) Transcript_8606:222-1034(-)|eukprot:CAMPEP_0178411194 /NCGR_PEP_ID=MMETSP0689_2-20121128/21369_1 /TAXON_ID=160604 /ORGANISM="Amphidinium massartii, Strain CS-259" /LENGTH=270 /DNA_ID=CAMNT_0020032393 /DNA_START=56 /DNA_END=868 /DNA_ORIENTATION=-